ncbi:hypothetical protein BJF94_13780 [Acinetobacter radioresistens]|nr:hypothetical protein BJF94_13780 [Acinetobacter radioresistens]
MVFLLFVRDRINANKNHYLHPLVKIFVLIASGCSVFYTVFKTLQPLFYHLLNECLFFKLKSDFKFLNLTHLK